MEQIKPQADRCIFPAGHGVIALASGQRPSLGCATGYLSSVMSRSSTNRVLPQLHILQNWKETKAYINDVYLLPQGLDERVARQLLPSLMLTSSSWQWRGPLTLVLRLGSFGRLAALRCVTFGRGC